MWYVIAEYIPGTIGWWGAYENEEDADKVASQVNGVALKIKDWKAFASIMNKGFDPLESAERVM